MVSDGTNGLLEPLQTARRLLERTNSRLLWKYFRIFIILVGGALLTSGAIDLVFSFQDQRDALANTERQRAVLAAELIERFIDQIEAEIQDAAKTPQSNNPAGLTQRHVNYVAFLKHVPAVTDIAYIDTAGKEQLRVSRIAVDLIGMEADYSQAAEFLEAKNQKTYFGPIYFRHESEPYLTISVAERGPNAGVVVADVNLKFIWDVVSEIKVGKSGKAYVVDSRGILVAHPDISLVLKKTSLSPLLQIQKALKASTQPGKLDQAEVTIARDIQGNRVLSTYLPIRTLGWLVFVEQPLGEAFAPLRFSILRTAWLLVGGLLASVLASLFLAQKMVAPIKVLHEGAARIAGGALDQTIEIHTGDELEDLSEEFNRMTARLRVSNAAMEQKVRDLGVAYAELEHKNLQLEDAQEQLVRTEKLAAIGQLAGGVAHDLRNPLGAIKNAIYYLNRKLGANEEARQNPRIKQFLNIIEEEVDHSNQIITDLLSFTRLSTLSVSNVNLGEIIDNTLSGIEIKEQTQIIKEFDVELPEVLADGDQLQRVFANLTLNAQEAMPEGGVLTIATRRKDGFAEVMFKDTGMGIDDEAMKNIFDPLFTTKTKGTGLGLAVCQQVVAKHGGTIQAMSENGDGAIFTIKLPLNTNGQG